MSVDSSFSDDLAYVPKQSSNQPTAVIRAHPGRLHGVTPLPLVIAAITIGAGGIAAVVSGANIALTILIGYCALASTVACLRTNAAMQQPVGGGTIDVAAPRDTTVAWKLVSTFSVSDASRLLCNIEPGAAATQESLAWGRALIDAIKQGELALAMRDGAATGTVERERENPHYLTEVTREALRAWVDRRGAVPEFLRA